MQIGRLHKKFYDPPKATRKVVMNGVRVWGPRTTPHSNIDVPNWVVKSERFMRFPVFYGRNRHLEF